MKKHSAVKVAYRNTGLICLLFVASCLPASTQQMKDLSSNIIVSNPANKSDFPIVNMNHVTAPLCYDTND